jgi:hypothetical protein
MHQRTEGDEVRDELVVPRTIAHWRQPRERVTTHAVHQRSHQIVFASEIPVEARDTAAHSASEVRHAELIQALELDDPGRRVEDVVRVQRATGTTGATHRVTRHKRTVVIVCITGSVIVCIAKPKLYEPHFVAEEA